MQLKMIVFQLRLAILLLFSQTGGNAEKVLDFSDDNDWKPDNESVYTHASLEKKDLPKSFTICAAFMVEFWTQETNANLFTLLNAKKQWLALSLWSKESETMLKINLSEDVVEVILPFLFFPL